MGVTKWNSDVLLQKTETAILQATEHSCLFLEGDIKKNFTVRGSGRLYRRGHRASLPGQPPAVDTGTLRASTGYQVVQEEGKIVGYVGINDKVLTMKAIQRTLKSKKKLTAEGRSNWFYALAKGGLKKYGLFLEIGTSKMAPRPYLRPALARSTDIIKGFFESYIKKVFA